MALRSAPSGPEEVVEGDVVRLMVGGDPLGGVCDGRIVGPLEEVIGGEEEGRGGDGRRGVATEVLAPTLVGG